MYRKAHGAAINPVMAGEIETSKGSKIDTDGRYLDNGLELLKEAVPKLARVAFLYDPARVDIRRMKEVQTTARPLGLLLPFGRYGARKVSRRFSLELRRNARMDSK